MGKGVTLLKRLVRTLLKSKGYVAPMKAYQPPLPPDIAQDAEFQELYRKCCPFTITSGERMYALFKAVQYVVNNQVRGDLVECGVWRGGSMMLAALALDRLGERQRKLFLYDTFAGMPEPTEKDVDYDGKSVEHYLRQSGQTLQELCFASIDEVRQNLHSTGYPIDEMVFVKGRVEETIPKVAPDQVCLLRLDTDWYQSTYHELVHLLPRLSVGGVLIIDDYGHWRGAREATDKYFAEHRKKILLSRIDYTGRIGIKVE